MEVIVMVGNIGSGKSTKVKELQAMGYVVIARDTLRYAIGGGKYVFNYKYEPIIHATEKYLFRKFLDLGVNIVVDETNVTVEGRAVIIKEAKQRGYTVKCIVMKKLSKELSVDRRMTNPHDCPVREVWEEVWEKFDSMYVAPLEDEGFDLVETYMGGE